MSAGKASEWVDVARQLKDLLAKKKGVVYDGIISSPDGRHFDAFRGSANRVRQAGHVSWLSGQHVMKALERVPAEDLPIRGSYEGSAALVLSLVGKTPAGHIDTVFATQRFDLDHADLGFHSGSGFTKKLMLITIRYPDDTFEYELSFSQATFTLPEIRELWTLSSSDLGGSRSRQVIRTRPAPLPLDQAAAITRAQLQAAGIMSDNINPDCNSGSFIRDRDCRATMREMLEHNRLFEHLAAPL